MVKREDLLNINFYKKLPFTGSDAGLRYRISKTGTDEGDALEVVAFPGPYAFDATPDEKKKSKLFEFSNEALSKIADYLSSEEVRKEVLGD